MEHTEADALPLRGRQREAQINDEAILDAARNVFGERGWGASMTEIAARAQTGVASIYRRYPSKELLVNAIRIASLERVCALAQRCIGGAGSDKPGESTVERFLRGHIAEASSPFALTVGTEVGATPRVGELSEHLRVLVEELIGIDQRRRLVPVAYTAADLMLTIVHLRPRLLIDSGRAKEFHLRELEYTVAGLQAIAAEGRQMPGKPASWDEWLRINGVE